MIGGIVAAALLVFVASSLWMFANTPPARLAAIFRRAGPAALMAGGVGLTLAGRAAIGVPLVLLGIAAYRRNLFKGRSTADASPHVSQVRSAALEMRLDHETGDLDGLVLAGAFTGRSLSTLEPSELMTLRSDLAVDAESLRLLEAYLDRRLAGWRADAEPKMGDGLGGTPGTGPMTEQQAYQILGLEAGASLAEVREAHRRLMKRVHPDHGGTDFLAARINEAKAFLVERHR